ncbi:MAG: SH3 domain-containing protein [Lachnospiraceae bacterium]|nr:SH3 domain-containing protein [Lachnospiraceae bacterium]
MQKDKVDAFLDFVLEHSKIVFPVTVIAAVAITVSVGLNANRARAVSEDPNLTATPVPTSMAPDAAATAMPDAVEAIANPEPQVQPETQELQRVSEEVPLQPNEDDGVHSLIVTYYNAYAMGDCDTLAEICDILSENDKLRCLETAKYLDHYPSVEIYTKPGLEEGSTLAYVYYRVCFVNHEEEFPGYEVFYICDNGEGNLYIKNEENFSEEEKDYIAAVTLQDDAVEFNNRVNAEYNDMIESNPQLWVYLRELGTQVDVAVGSALAAQVPEEDGQGENPEGDGTEGTEPEETVAPPEDMGPRFASATTTVNVRNSDSEQADKVGKITGGTRIEVQEVLLNGWTKVIYEGSDGYIKSEFLVMEESTGDGQDTGSGQEVIGTVTAIESVKIRASASLEGERLGVLTAGESLELLANEDGWCKVLFEGRVAYVKAEHVRQ